MRRTTLPAILLALGVTAGCDGGHLRSSAEVESALEKIVSDRMIKDAEFDETSFDFGELLASDQDLRHRFEIKNRSQLPLRIIGVEAMTPCCSAVESVTAREIPPGGSGTVAVRLKPGHQTGRRSVDFVVRTDAADSPLRRLRLQVTNLASWEIEARSDAPARLLVGRSGKIAYKIICRHKAEMGRSLPKSIGVESPLAASFDGEASTRSLLGGIVEERRGFAVQIPASARPGHRSGSLALAWADGLTEAFPLMWEIRPHVEPIPASLIITAEEGDQQRDIRLVSRSDPFCVKSVTSRMVKAFDIVGRTSQPERSCTLRLILNTEGLGPPFSSEIVVLLDHPEQQEIRLPVVVVPAAARNSDARD